MGRKIPGIDDDFMDQVDKIVDEADKLLQVRGDQYNRDGVTLHDQYRIYPGEHPKHAYWAVLHIRFFRLKSMMQGLTSNELTFETLRDLLNETRFLYASIKCNK